MNLPNPEKNQKGDTTYFIIDEIPEETKKFKTQLKKETELFKNKESIVCAGDTITGWNPRYLLNWPYITYTVFLEDLLPEKKIVNAGYEQATSNESLNIVKDYLGLCPLVKYFIICFGSQDLISEPYKETSKTIIYNLNTTFELFEKKDKIILLNIPHVAKSFTSNYNTSEKINSAIDDHNTQLKKYFTEFLKIIDICSELKDKHLLEDKIHPNRNGSEIIAKKIYKYINNKTT